MTNDEMKAAWLAGGFAAQLGVACGACAQQPGEVCVDWHDSADPARYTPMERPHAERFDAAMFKASIEAGALGHPVREVTYAVVSKIADESGLV